jgi:hypothetical protein
MKNTTTNKAIPEITYRLPDGTPNPQYFEKWKRENPDKVREHNRKASAKTRQTEEWKEYLRNYRREWYKKNRYLQYIRSIPSGLRHMLKQGKGQDMREESSTILENLYAIGWTIETDQHINHKVSLYWLMKINPELPKTIAFDKVNIELVDKADNHKLKNREVTRRTLEYAIALESKYPKELKGLANLIKKNLGEVR